MPLYEYRCNSCGAVFEVIQKFSEEPLKTHAQCGGEVERLISLSALQFKGSGWYVTDYAKGSNGKAGKEPSKDSPAAKENGGSKEPKAAKTDSPSPSSSSPAPGASK
jgi:putative FmdB family regulatory protein